MNSNKTTPTYEALHARVKSIDGVELYRQGSRYSLYNGDKAHGAGLIVETADRAVIDDHIDSWVAAAEDTTTGTDNDDDQTQAAVGGHTNGAPPPGGLTPDTPGRTDAVAAALNKAQANQDAESGQSVEPVSTEAAEPVAVSADTTTDSLTPDPHKRLGDYFNPEKGDGNVRAFSVGAQMDELRESMRLHGWVDQPEFYAVADENGVVIIGHRRMAVAAQLDIEPRIRIMDFRQFGSGDAADIERMKLAVLSNIGGVGMSKKDRLPLVQRLAGDWTQMSIAEALGVSREQIKKDIAELRQRGDLVPSTKSRQGGPGKSRPKKGAAGANGTATSPNGGTGGTQNVAVEGEPIDGHTDTDTTDTAQPVTESIITTESTDGIGAIEEPITEPTPASTAEPINDEDDTNKDDDDDARQARDHHDYQVRELDSAAQYLEDAAGIFQHELDNGGLVLSPQEVRELLERINPALNTLLIGQDELEELGAVVVTP